MRMGTGTNSFVSSYSSFLPVRKSWFQNVNISILQSRGPYKNPNRTVIGWGCCLISLRRTKSRGQKWTHRHFHNTELTDLKFWTNLLHHNAPACFWNICPKAIARSVLSAATLWPHNNGIIHCQFRCNVKQMRSIMLFQSMFTSLYAPKNHDRSHAQPCYNGISNV